MALRGERLAGLLLISCIASGQKFPMRYLAEIGHLENHQIVDLGTAQVRADASGASLVGRDREGKPWRVALALTGGVGWT